MCTSLTLELLDVCTHSGLILCLKTIQLEVYKTTFRVICPPVMSSKTLCSGVSIYANIGGYVCCGHIKKISSHTLLRLQVLLFEVFMWICCLASFGWLLEKPRRRYHTTMSTNSTTSFSSFLVLSLYSAGNTAARGSSHFRRPFSLVFLVDRWVSTLICNVVCPSHHFVWQEIGKVVIIFF